MPGSIGRFEPTLIVPGGEEFLMHTLLRDECVRAEYSEGEQGQLLRLGKGETRSYKIPVLNDP